MHRRSAAKDDGRLSQTILTKGFGTRGHVDLVDLQLPPDGEFKYLIDELPGVLAQLLDAFG